MSKPVNNTFVFFTGQYFLLCIQRCMQIHLCILQISEKKGDLPKVIWQLCGEEQVSAEEKTTKLNSICSKNVSQETVT